MNLKGFQLWIVLISSIGFGFALGWYWGYTRPPIEEYRDLKEMLQVEMTDEEMAELGAYLPEMREDLKRSDEFAAALAFWSLISLENGDVEKTKDRMGKVLATYYYRHQQDGNPNFVARIESYAATNAAISNAIDVKSD